MFCLQHVHDDMRILLSHQRHDIRDLIGGYDRMQQIHLLPAVSAHRLYIGDPMTVLGYIAPDDRLRMGCGDLEGHPLITVMEGGEGPGGDELE